MRVVVGLPGHSFSPLLLRLPQRSLYSSSFIRRGCVAGLQGTFSTKDYIEIMNYEFKMKWPRWYKVCEVYGVPLRAKASCHAAGSSMLEDEA